MLPPWDRCAVGCSASGAPGTTLSGRSAARPVVDERSSCAVRTGVRARCRAPGSPRGVPSEDSGPDSAAVQAVELHSLGLQRRSTCAPLDRPRRDDGVAFFRAIGDGSHSAFEFFEESQDRPARHLPFVDGRFAYDERRQLGFGDFRSAADGMGPCGAFRVRGGDVEDEDEFWFFERSFDLFEFGDVDRTRDPLFSFLARRPFFAGGTAGARGARRALGTDVPFQRFQYLRADLLRRVDQVVIGRQGAAAHCEDERQGRGHVGVGNPLPHVSPSSSLFWSRQPTRVSGGHRREQAIVRSGRTPMTARPSTLRSPMPTYIMLSTLTPEGVQTVKNNPQRIREVNKEVEQLGATVKEQWATLGHVDFISIIEAPDEGTMARVSLELGSRGTGRYETLAAIPIDDFIASL